MLKQKAILTIHVNHTIPQFLLATVLIKIAGYV